MGQDFFTRKQYPLQSQIAIKDDAEKQVEVIVQESGVDKVKRKVGQATCKVGEILKAKGEGLVLHLKPGKYAEEDMENIENKMTIGNDDTSDSRSSIASFKGSNIGTITLKISSEFQFKHNFNTKLSKVLTKHQESLTGRVSIISLGSDEHKSLSRERTTSIVKVLANRSASKY